MIVIDTVKLPALPLRNLRLTPLLALLVLLGACSSTPEDSPELQVGAQLASQQTQEKWLCTGTAQQSWHCRPQGEATATAATPASPQATPRPVPPSRSPIETQLASAPKGAVIVQLIAARSQSTLEQYKAEQPALPYEQVAIQNKGETWQLLFLGPYNNRRQAEDIVEALSPFPEPTWIREVDSFRDWLVQ